MTKGNSPIIHFDGSKNDNVTDSNSPIRRDNSPIDSKVQS
jgi:hypothetical protein